MVALKTRPSVLGINRSFYFCQPTGFVPGPSKSRAFQVLGLLAGKASASPPLEACPAPATQAHSLSPSPCSLVLPVRAAVMSHFNHRGQECFKESLQ